VILVDANLLLYAYDASSKRHEAARRWWESRLSGPEPVWLAWHSVVAFLRIGTHIRVFTHPFTLEEACRVVGSWFDGPAVGLLEPGPRHWEILRGLLLHSQASGNLVTDAHLAALAIEHGMVLMSPDRDFARFPGLAWKDPLTP
jgi:hypothetical protein